MPPVRAIAALQKYASNVLKIDALGDRQIAGVIGDAPSTYSKSPCLWNAAFDLIGLNAVYLPLDVAEERLKDFTTALRQSPSILGVNITVPYKLKIIEHLDALDPAAARIQAVNTIVRTVDGKLAGYNTDGEGFVEGILKPQPGNDSGFVESLGGMDVLLIGAGGSARALAFHLADRLNGGELLICNRTRESADSLSAEIRKLGCKARGVGEEELSLWAPRVGLIINSTSKGQGGAPRVAGGLVTAMERYSALAPANPAAGSQTDAAISEPRDGARQKASAVQNNHEASLNLARLIPSRVRFYDLIYVPEETVFLQHARLTGHPTMNGKSMIINQAVIAFCERICQPQLRSRGIDNPETRRRILESMYRAW